MRLFLLFVGAAFAFLVLPVPDARAQSIRQVEPGSYLSTVIGMAVLGDVDSQFEAGSAYFNGNGVPVNKVEGVKYIRRAANNGHTVSEALMGNFYSTGEGGLTPDKAEGIKWFRRAAVKGWSPAQLSLSFAYKDMRDVPDNDIIAYSWFSIALAKGDKQAGQFKDRMEQGMTTKDKIAAVKLAKKCLISEYKDCG